MAGVPGPIPLTLLRSGERARIQQLAGQSELVRRMEEMGLRAGQQVEMLQAGSPCIIRLAEHKLCLRADELLTVLVEVEAAS